MRRWYGKVGYLVTVETALDVFEEKIVERSYYGELDRQISHTQNGDGINKNVQCNMQVSIVADAFAYEHFQDIRYVTWQNSKWEITSADASNRPRIVLNFGGVYKEEEGD